MAALTHSRRELLGFGDRVWVGRSAVDDFRIRVIWGKKQSGREHGDTIKDKFRQRRHLRRARHRLRGRPAQERAVRFQIQRLFIEQTWL